MKIWIMEDEWYSVQVLENASDVDIACNPDTPNLVDISEEKYNEYKEKFKVFKEMQKELFGLVEKRKEQYYKEHPEDATRYTMVSSASLDLDYIERNNLGITYGD